MLVMDIPLQHKPLQELVLKLALYPIRRRRDLWETISIQNSQRINKCIITPQINILNNLILLLLFKPNSVTLYL